MFGLATALVVAAAPAHRNLGDLILGALAIGAVLAILRWAILLARRGRGGAEPPPRPPAGPAWAGAATRQALRRYLLRALLAILGSLLVATGAGALLGASSGGLGERVGGILAVAGFLGVAIGLLASLNAGRIWLRLRRHRWRAWRCRFRVVSGFANGSPTLVLSDPARSGQEYVLSVLSLKWRWQALAPCDGGEVWLAGDPARGGVVSPPGGTELLWVRRPLNARRRESLRLATAAPGSS